MVVSPAQGARPLAVTFHPGQVLRISLHHTTTAPLQAGGKCGVGSAGEQRKAEGKGGYRELL